MLPTIWPADSVTVRLRVCGTSMLPALWHGDMVTVRYKRAAEVAAGDIVLIILHGRLCVHRVVDKVPARRAATTYYARRPPGPKRSSHRAGASAGTGRLGQARLGPQRTGRASLSLGKSALLDFALFEHAGEDPDARSNAALSRSKRTRRRQARLSGSIAVHGGRSDFRSRIIASHTGKRFDATREPLLRCSDISCVF